jgi:hypothetical protein
MTKKPTQQQLWTNQMLEFLHQYFIGISNLTCTEETCPLVLNWGDLEKKNSQQGKSALYLISNKDKQWITADLISYEENDLGGYSEVEIKLRSETTRRMKPSYDLPEPVKVSGYSHKPKPPREIFLKNEEVVLFFNNSAKTANLEDAETIYLKDLWNLKEKIKWDQTASKKKIINWVEQKPDPDDKSYKISEWEQDYIFWLAHPDTTNEIKAHEVYQAQNTKEREQLWTDYKEGFSELRRVYGIRHLTSKKEDRQNNPEIELNESQFIALERDKYRERIKSIREFEKKGGCPGKHTLSYGGYEEHQEALELEQAVDMNMNKEKNPTQKLEAEWEQIKKGSEEPKDK